jgi:hypothetical protein
LSCMVFQFLDVNGIVLCHFPIPYCHHA